MHGSRVACGGGHAAVGKFGCCGCAVVDVKAVMARAIRHGLMMNHETPDCRSQAIDQIGAYTTVYVREPVLCALGFVSS
jgi:hypothetical protein